MNIYKNTLKNMDDGALRREGSALSRIYAQGHMDSTERHLKMSVLEEELSARRQARMLKVEWLEWEVTDKVINLLEKHR